MFTTLRLRSQSEQLLARLREGRDVRVVIALKVESPNDSEIERTRSLKRAQRRANAFSQPPAHPFRRAR